MNVLINKRFVNKNIKKKKKKKKSRTRYYRLFKATKAYISPALMRVLH